MLTKQEIAEIRVWPHLRKDIPALLSHIDEQAAEIEWLRKRDGNASIRLLWPTEDDPFRRLGCTKIDFGVADNIYVVERADVVTEIEQLKELLTRSRCGNEGCCYPVEPVGGFIWCEWCRRKHTLLAEGA